MSGLLFERGILTNSEIIEELNFDLLYRRMESSFVEEHDESEEKSDKELSINTIIDLESAYNRIKIGLLNELSTLEKLNERDLSVGWRTYSSIKSMDEDVSVRKLIS